MAIISIDEFKLLKDTSSKSTPDYLKRVQESINLAQSVDLYDVLDSFLFDVIANEDSTSYVDLLEGSSFEYQGRNYIHEGIKSLLADYAYARLVYKANFNLTSFGATTKLSQHSEPIDRNMLKDLVKQSQIDTQVKFKLIDTYLRANTALFPNYSTGNNPDINTFSIKTSTLR